MKRITKRLNNCIVPTIIRNSEIHNTVKKEVNVCMRDIGASDKISADEKWKQIQS